MFMGELPIYMFMGELPIYRDNFTSQLEFSKLIFFVKIDFLCKSLYNFLELLGHLKWLTHETT
jgi:hypothetical protein